MTQIQQLQKEMEEKAKIRTTLTLERDSLHCTLEREQMSTQQRREEQMRHVLEMKELQNEKERVSELYNQLILEQKDYVKKSTSLQEKTGVTRTLFQESY